MKDLINSLLNYEEKRDFEAIKLKNTIIELRQEVDGLRKCRDYLEDIKPLSLRKDEVTK